LQTFLLDEVWTEYLTAAQESRVNDVDFAGLTELSALMLDDLVELERRLTASFDTLPGEDPT